MNFRWKSYGAVVTPLLISAFAAGAVFFAKRFVRIKLRSTVLFFCEAQAYEMLDVLTKTGINNNINNFIERNEGTFITLTLNWNKTKPLFVPLIVFNDNRFNMKEIFNIYTGLYKNNHPDKILVCDIWNSLIALIEYNLQHQITYDNSPLLDEVKVEELLTICILLRGKYSIFKKIYSNKSKLFIKEFPEDFFKILLNSYYKGKSMRLGLFSFLKLIFSSCSIRQLIILITIMFISPDTILKVFFGLQTDVNWTTLYTAEMLKIPNKDIIGNYSIIQFIKKQFKGTPANFAAIAVASIGPVELIYCLREFIINYVLMDLVMSFHLNAYLSLATADYDSTENWPLSQRVSQALWNASNSVMGELQNQIPYLLEIFCGFLVVLRFPLIALSMWLGTQWSDFVDFLAESFYLESQYAKSYFNLNKDIFLNLENNNNNNNNNKLFNSPSPISLFMSTGNQIFGNISPIETNLSYSSLPHDIYQGMKSQYGLTLLTLVYIESNSKLKLSWTILFRHLSWPVSPIIFIKYIISTLEKVHNDNENIIGINKILWVKTILKNILKINKFNPCVSYNSSYKQEYLKGFMTFRYGGIELDATKLILGFSPNSRNDRQEDCIRDILRGIFRTADALPFLLSSLVLLYIPHGFFKQDTLQQNDSISHLRFIKHLYPIFPTITGIFYVENGLSESQIDFISIQRKLSLNGSSLGCYQILEELQYVQHKIDKPIKNYISYPSMEGAWSIEFRSVSFRYSENHPYILWRVSFLIKHGEFFGIIGYSGSGKTTILRLINRIYNPTSGDIFINGFHISVYPIRMIRRRISNVWQEENNLKFFDNLSIANNIAFGNLLDSSESNIKNVLSSAEALNFIQKRSSGIYSQLCVGEFSGGELERLSLARALMKRKYKVSLYTLDEATSAIDTSTEEKIFNVFGLNKNINKPRNATFIVISHRLATLKNANKILVLNNGEVEQIGNWDELCKSEPNSCFSKMLRFQKLPSFIN